jgi:thrombospondin type 3 repeat protein
MKTFYFGVLMLALTVDNRAATTINSVNKFSYGANIGWTDWRGDVVGGAVIGEFICTGNIYAANVGWIRLGSGTPANAIRYQNNSAADYGVNHDGLGNLRGYAYGANIGWLTFTNRDTAGAFYDGPRVDLLTGRLSGFVWSANCGWISLSNQFAFVQTDTIQMGADSDGDGIPDAWEQLNFGNLSTADGSSDRDGDGFSDLSEYLADTNPADPNSNLRIISYLVDPGGSFA